MAFHLYGAILCGFWDKARYWSKIGIFFIPTALHTTSRWGKRLQIFLRFFTQLSEILGLAGYVNRFWKSLLFMHSSRASRTDGQTDRRKSDLNSAAYVTLARTFKSGHHTDRHTCTAKSVNLSVRLTRLLLSLQRGVEAALCAWHNVADVTVAIYRLYCHPIGA